MKIGFIGTGEIAAAVVTGMRRTEDMANWPIWLTPRSRHVAERLAQTFGDITIATDNQAVIDAAELVFLAIRPQIAEDVVRALRFRPDQLVVSFVAATPLDRLSTWIDAPVRLVQAIPLPFVATLSGPTAIHPPDAVVASIFNRLGTAIEVDNVGQYDLLGAASAIMGSYFGMLETVTRWLEQEGLPYDDGRAYIARIAGALSDTALASPAKSFETLRLDHTTEGGLNAQVHDDFLTAGGGERLRAALNAVYARIRRGG